MRPSDLRHPPQGPNEGAQPPHAKAAQGGAPHLPLAEESTASASARARAVGGPPEGGGPSRGPVDQSTCPKCSAPEQNKEGLPSIQQGVPLTANDPTEGGGGPGSLGAPEGSRWQLSINKETGRESSPRGCPGTPGTSRGPGIHGSPRDPSQPTCFPPVLRPSSLALPRQEGPLSAREENSETPDDANWDSMYKRVNSRPSASGSSTDKFRHSGDVVGCGGVVA